MSTTIQFHGQTVTFTHPRELRSWGHPTPPLQPVSHWPGSLAHFVRLCEQDQFDTALSSLRADHCSATLADVPEEKRDAFKAWAQKTLRATPAVLVGAAGDWFADGIARPNGGS